MRGWLAMPAIVLAAATAGGQESLPIKTMTAIKDATVMIVAAPESDPGRAVTGSGFVIRVEGRTGYIVTNQHVIRPGEGLPAGRTVNRVVFRAGTRAESSAVAEVVASSADPDLAILKVSGVADLPTAIDVEREPELVETMPIYVFGFPFGRSLALGRGKPSVVVGRGSVSSIRSNEEGRAVAVLIDGALNPGNSGGPVVDAQGRLVGVAVATIRGAHIGIAIAPPELLGMLEGRPEGLRVTAKPARDGAVSLSFDVPLVDPLGRIKTVAVLYALGTPGTAAPAKDGKETSWGPLAGARRVELNVVAHRGEGSVTIPAPKGKDLDLTYQLAHVDGRGRTVHARPAHYLIAGGSPGARGLDTWGSVIDPDGDCTVRIVGGTVTVEVPGTFHDLNAEIGKFNAPRILRDVEGDFVAQVKVTGDFRPEGPSTREQALPYDGAGLVVWLDADHFIRMERGAVLRREKVGAFLLFERREQGRLGARNNGYLEEGDVYLKIERRGGRISGAYSTDGREWAEARPMEIGWPSRLKVGVGVVSTSFAPLKVRFEEFTLRKPDPEK